MEILMWLPIPELIILFVYMIKKIFELVEKQPQARDGFPVDAAVFTVSEIETVVDVIDSV